MLGLDQCMPTNAVYIKRMKWRQFPKQARSEIPYTRSDLFVLFDRKGYPLRITDDRICAVSTAIHLDAKIFTLH